MSVRPDVALILSRIERAILCPDRPPDGVKVDHRGREVCFTFDRINFFMKKVGPMPNFKARFHLRLNDRPSATVAIPCDDASLDAYSFQAAIDRFLTADVMNS
jgi:hypothetical protein